MRFSAKALPSQAGILHEKSPPVNTGDHGSDAESMGRDLEPKVGEDVRWSG